MFPCDGCFTLKVFGLHIDTCHLRSEVFSLDAYSGKEIGKRTALWHPQLAFHHVCVQTEESLVTLGTNDGKSLVIYSAFIQDTRKFSFCLLQFGSCFNSLNFQKSLLYQFCTTSLNSKISLCKSNLRLSWVTILCDQIASIAGEHNVIHFSLGTFCDVYHFADVSKMIRNRLSCISTCLFGFVNDITEITPLLIAK